MKFIINNTEICYVDNTGKALARIEYPEISPNCFDICHTFVDESLRRQGIAGKLVQMAVLEINKYGGELTASCSYAAKWIEKHGIRPYVTCHMVTSIDGKVTGDFLTSNAGLLAAEDYYEINRQLKGDAFACGRITMEGSFTQGFRPDLSAFTNAEIPREDHIARRHSYYAVSFDRLGRVGWTDGILHDEDAGYDDCHIIEVLTEDTPSENLAYYQSVGASYLFAGAHEIDIQMALRKLYQLFGIRRLVLEGGSIINGAFLQADAVDELSLVMAPVIADKEDKQLFDSSAFHAFSMTSAEELESGAVWLRYVDRERFS